MKQSTPLRRTWRRRSLLYFSGECSGGEARKKLRCIRLISGFALGVVAFILDLPVFGTEKIITHRWGIPFMMQAWWMFCICSVIYVVVTFLHLRPHRNPWMALPGVIRWAALTQEQFKGSRDPR